jgi:hypothetical protein
MGRFFKIVFGSMLLCLILCVIQLARVTCDYEILNFFEEKKIIALNPQQVAKQYILSLKKKDYRIAYDYLTPESKETISLADFVTMNEKQMTLMDENKTWVYYQEVRIGMQIYEDPGWWGFVLVKDNGKWRIRMKGGIPSFPFVWQYGCGNE